MNWLRELLRGAAEVVGPDLLAAVFRRMRRRMRKWDVQRVRSVAEQVVCFLLIAVFALGLVWSVASRHDERGPIAKVVAEVVAAVLRVFGVAGAVVFVAIAVIGWQLFLHGGDLRDWIILLGIAACLLALLTFVFWLALLVV